MKNGWLHDYLVADLATAARRLGSVAMCEYPVPGGGWVDLLVNGPCGSIVCEVEASSPRRTLQDLSKAVRLDAHALLVVTPTRQLADLCAARLRGQRVPDLQTFVCPHGQARRRLAALLTSRSPSPERRHIRRTNATGGGRHA